MGEAVDESLKCLPEWAVRVALYAKSILHIRTCCTLFLARRWTRLKRLSSLLVWRYILFCSLTVWRCKTAAARERCWKQHAVFTPLLFRKGPRKIHRTGQSSACFRGRVWSFSGALRNNQSSVAEWGDLSCWPGQRPWPGQWMWLIAAVFASSISPAAATRRRPCQLLILQLWICIVPQSIHPQQVTEVCSGLCGRRLSQQYRGVRFLGSCCSHCGHPCTSFYRVIIFVSCISWGRAPSQHCSGSWYRWLWKLSFSSLDDFRWVVIFLGALPQARQSMFHQGEWNVELYYERQVCVALNCCICDRSLLNRAPGNILRTCRCVCSGLFVPVCLQEL